MGRLSDFATFCWCCSYGRVFFFIIILENNFFPKLFLRLTASPLLRAFDSVCPFRAAGMATAHQSWEEAGPGYLWVEQGDGQGSFQALPTGTPAGAAPEPAGLLLRARVHAQAPGRGHGLFHCTLTHLSTICWETGVSEHPTGPPQSCPSRTSVCGTRPSACDHAGHC